MTTHSESQHKIKSAKIINYGQNNTFLTLSGNLRCLEQGLHTKMPRNSCQLLRMNKVSWQLNIQQNKPLLSTQLAQ